MIKLEMSRKPTRGKHFLEYLLAVGVGAKTYDLAVTFLIWAQITPNQGTAFFLRPEAQAGTHKEPRTPVEKKEVLPGMYEYSWKEGIKEIRHCINTISFPLNQKDNVELFTYCLRDPVRFSQTYQERLKELEAYSVEHDQEIWSAPRWSEVNSESLVPVEKVPKEADEFFLHVFKLRFETAGYEIHD